MVESDETVMTAQEAAKYLKVGMSTLYKLAKNGDIPSRKIGKQWRFHKDALDEWLKANIGQ